MLSVGWVVGKLVALRCAFLLILLRMISTIGGCPEHDAGQMYRLLHPPSPCSRKKWLHHVFHEALDVSRTNDEISYGIHLRMRWPLTIAIGGSCQPSVPSQHIELCSEMSMPLWLHRSNARRGATHIDMSS